MPTEGDPLLSNLSPYSYSSARFGDDPASQIPVREARRRAVLAINRARITARYPRHSHRGLVLREEWEEREEMSPFVLPCQNYSTVLPPPPDLARRR